MDQRTVLFLLVVAVFALKCGAQKLISSYPVTGEEFHKMVFNKDRLFVGGKKNVYMFDSSQTLLVPENVKAICTESCETNVNKILLINSPANELIECSSGDNGLCKVRDLDSLTVKWNSSYIVTEGNKHVERGLTVSTEKDYPAQAHLTGTHLVIATTPSRGVPVNYDNRFLCISMWTLNPFSKSSDLYLNKDYFNIRYVASFKNGHYSYIFTNQKQFSNKTTMVSKVVRLNQRFAYPVRSYRNFVIECKDTTTAKAYMILKDAILVHINGTPTLAAIFTTTSIDDGSILCTKPLADIDKQAIESWINFIKYCPITNGSYFIQKCASEYSNRALISEELRSEGPNSTNPFDPQIFYSVDLAVLPMTYVASSFPQEGSMITMHDSVLNNQHVLTVGTIFGFVMQFVHTDGTYQRFNTFQVSDSTSIDGLYQQLDTDHSLFVMTRSELYKYASTSCNEYLGSHCVKSGVMEGKNPLCGWCIYDQRASLKSDCSCNLTVCWLSSLTSCLKLDIEPKGAPAGTGMFQTQTCPQLANHNDQFYVPSGVHSSITINVTNSFPTVNVSFRLIGANFGIDSSCKTAFPQITCGLKALINGKKNSVPILIQYLSSKNGWVSIDDKYNVTLTFYNCSNLGECGCNYCKALNSNRYKCAWDTTANMCMFNENSSSIGTTDCPSPTIMKISPEDGPYTGAVVVTLIGNEFGLVEKEPISGPVIVSGKSCLSIVDIIYVPDDRLDFMHNVRTGFRCRSSSRPVNNNTIFTISSKPSILGHDFKPLILKNSTITRVYPDYGPRAGGTRITFYGENLGIGNRNLETVRVHGKELIGSNISSINDGTGQDVYVIIGEIPTGDFIGNTSIVVLLNDVVIISESATFSFLENPTIKDMNPKHGFLSGGTILTVTGDTLANAQLPRVFLRGHESGENLRLLSFSDVNITIGIEKCRIVEQSDNLIVCNAPTEQPKPGMAGIENPEVNVTIGNIKTTLGYLKYKTEVQNIPLIAGASAGGAAVLILIVASVAFIKSRKRIAKAKAMNAELNYGELHENIRPPEEHPYSHIVHG